MYTAYTNTHDMSAMDVLDTVALIDQQANYESSMQHLSLPPTISHSLGVCNTTTHNVHTAATVQTAAVIALESEAELAGKLSAKDPAYKHLFQRKRDCVAALQLQKQQSHQRIHRDTDSDAAFAGVVHPITDTPFRWHAAPDSTDCDAAERDKQAARIQRRHSKHAMNQHTRRAVQRTRIRGSASSSSDSGSENDVRSTSQGKNQCNTQSAPRRQVSPVMSDTNATSVDGNDGAHYLQRKRQRINALAEDVADIPANDSSQPACQHTTTTVQPPPDNTIATEHTNADMQQTRRRSRRTTGVNKAHNDDKYGYHSDSGR